MHCFAPLRAAAVFATKTASFTLRVGTIHAALIEPALGRAVLPPEPILQNTFRMCDALNGSSFEKPLSALTRERGSRVAPFGWLKVSLL